MRRRGGAGLIIALIMAAFALVQYFGSTQKNEITGEKQHVSGITARQEVALGLQAAPQMEAQFGGPSRDAKATALVENVGQQVVRESDAAKSGYPFEFHLLDDDQTINAFALPGGQVFITEALLKRLETRGQLAGVLGHEVGHVVARHGAEHIAKQKLSEGLTGAAVLATYDPNDPASSRNAAVIAAIGNLINLKYGRDDELESDKLGVRFISQAGYDPRSMIRVMEILKAAGGGGRAPEFFSTHPNPDNRIGKIKQAIQNTFPNGVPNDLQQ